MNRPILLSSLFLSCLLICTPTSAQTNPLTGTWKGTSVCQVKNSPCHDEIVVYHISQMSNPDSFRIAANKIVNNVEEEMGILEFSYNEAKHLLVSKNATRNDVWSFTLTGNKLEGTLYYRNQLYRIVNLTKQD